MRNFDMALSKRQASSQDDAPGNRKFPPGGQPREEDGTLTAQHRIRVQHVFADRLGLNGAKRYLRGLEVICLQGTPDFIPKLTGDAVTMKVIDRILSIPGPEAPSRRRAEVCFA